MNLILSLFFAGAALAGLVAGMVLVVLAIIMWPPSALVLIGTLVWLWRQTTKFVAQIRKPPVVVMRVVPKREPWPVKPAPSSLD